MKALVFWLATIWWCFPRADRLVRFASSRILMWFETAVLEIFNSFASSEIDRAGFLESLCSIRRLVLLPSAVKNKSASGLSNCIGRTACRTWFQSPAESFLKLCGFSSVNSEMRHKTPLFIVSQSVSFLVLNTVPSTPQNPRIIRPGVSFLVRNPGGELDMREGRNPSLMAFANAHCSLPARQEPWHISIVWKDLYSGETFWQFPFSWEVNRVLSQIL